MEEKIHHDVHDTNTLKSVEKKDVNLTYERLEIDSTNFQFMIKGT